MTWHAQIILVVLVVVGANSNAEVIQWSELPDLPDTLGVAGAFSGVSSHALIVAGGANFPEPLFKDGQVNPLAKRDQPQTNKTTNRNISLVLISHLTIKPFLHYILFLHACHGI